MALRTAGRRSAAGSAADRQETAGYDRSAALYHRTPGCTGGWIRERCGTFEVFRCTACFTRDTAPDACAAVVEPEWWIRHLG
jgi:hypothetical protein